MKKLISVLAACIFMLSAIAHTGQNAGQITATYCAILKDGKMMLMAEGKQVNNDVTLANGSIIKMDGTVEKIDKTKITLKNGDCIDQDGNIIPSDKKGTEKDKIKEEKKDQK